MPAGPARRDSQGCGAASEQHAWCVVEAPRGGRHLPGPPPLAPSPPRPAPEGLPLSWPLPALQVRPGSDSTREPGSWRTEGDSLARSPRFPGFADTSLFTSGGRRPRATVPAPRSGDSRIFQTLDQQKVTTSPQRLSGWLARFSNQVISAEIGPLTRGRTDGPTVSGRFREAKTEGAELPLPRGLGFAGETVDAPGRCTCGEQRGRPRAQDPEGGSRLRRRLRKESWERGPPARSVGMQTGAAAVEAPKNQRQSRHGIVQRHCRAYLWRRL